MVSETYAQMLADRAERAVKLLKILICVASAVFAGLLMFAALSASVIKDEQSVIIGLIVFMVILIVLVISVFAVIAYAFYHLNKLKKLK